MALNYMELNNIDTIKHKFGDGILSETVRPGPKIWSIRSYGVFL